MMNACCSPVELGEPEQPCMIAKGTLNNGQRQFLGQGTGKVLAIGYKPTAMTDLSKVQVRFLTHSEQYAPV